MNKNYIEKIKNKAIYFDEKAYENILNEIGNAQIVLLGEATHGTKEFYEMRAEISKKLITEKNFNAITIEGDWPDAYQINNFITDDNFSDPKESLSVFNRFPTWMWQNTEILKLIIWLKDFNKEKKEKINFFGLDLYSMYKSVDVIISYLEKVDAKAADEAKYYYSCFEQFRRDPQAYGYYVFSQLSESCQNEVIQELKNLENLQWKLIKEKKISQDDSFYLMQNAKVVKNSEIYYRSLYINEVNNWNLRDSHMMETLEEIIKYYNKKGIKKPKIIVWAHNSHIGNSAFTQMSLQEEFNIGQLVKEKFNNNSFSLGFTTYNGTVSAASNWDNPVERKIIRNALPESYEFLFHQIGIANFLLILNEKNLIPKNLLERAIGVVYMPQTERMSHYFYADLENQFDAVIHCDKTTALEPLEKTSKWIDGEVPETYPSGL